MKYTSFYERPEWERLRYRILHKHGPKCMACGATRADGVQIHVDHIKPIRVYPELALDEDNLQVLCRACNMGKSAIYDDDFRPAPRKMPVYTPPPREPDSPEVAAFLAQIRHQVAPHKYDERGDLILNPGSPV